MAAYFIIHTQKLQGSPVAAPRGLSIFNIVRPVFHIGAPKIKAAIPCLNSFQFFYPGFQKNGEDRKWLKVLMHVFTPETGGWPRRAILLR
jgi:hypothetical protein